MNEADSPQHRLSYSQDLRLGNCQQYGIGKPPRAKLKDSFKHRSRLCCHKN